MPTVLNMNGKKEITKVAEGDFAELSFTNYAEVKSCGNDQKSREEKKEKKIMQIEIIHQGGSGEVQII